MSWIDIKWKPKYEGPYLIKFKMPNPRKKGHFITRYSIKRYVVSLTPFRYPGRSQKILHGHYGYFSSGNLPAGNTMIPLAWMPIEGHDYMALEKNRELQSRLYDYNKITKN